MLELFVIFTIFIIAIFGQPEGVCHLDLAGYTGGWYELATSDFVASTLELDCICSSSYYTLTSADENILDVTNSCIHRSNDSFYSVTGNVFPAHFDEPQGNLRAIINERNYNVTNVNTMEANYIVMKLWKTDSKDVRYSLIGSNSTNEWWLISRSPNWNETVWRTAAHLLQAYDYNLTDWQRTEQTCQFLGKHGNNLIPPSK
jgi:lipocalin